MDDLAASNVNRSYSLAALCVAIFNFMLIFLYPRFVSGDVDGLLFQATFVVMGLTTFSLIFASLEYYRSSLGGSIGAAEQAMHLRRGDRLWLVGYSLLFLVPSLILVCVRLLIVGSVWIVLWLIYVAFVIRLFPEVQTRK